MSDQHNPGFSETWITDFDPEKAPKKRRRWGRGPTSVAPSYENPDSGAYGAPERSEPTRRMLIQRMARRWDADLVKAIEHRDRDVDHSFRRSSPPGGPAG